jgi:Ala-tRNA(Pro) deacylase
VAEKSRAASPNAEDVMRVPDYLTQQHVPFETLVHPPAFTAEKRARFLHVPGKQVAKCVLLACGPEFVLAVLPATHEIDTPALERALGGPVRLAEPDEMSRHFSDCEWGVLSPFGTLYGLPTLLDASFDPAELILFEAHAHAVAIRMVVRDYERLEKPRRLEFARPKQPPRPHDAAG